jgi:multiple sugar transport system substrate-binding protein
VFADGANAERMLNVLRFLRRTVAEGASPSRVATITTYDEFQQAAAGGAVATFLGGSFQWPQMKEELPEDVFAKWEVSEIPGRRAGETATGTGGWAMGALTDDPEKVAACASILEEVYIGEGNTVTGELPTSRRLYAELEAFQDPIFKTFRRFLRNGRARPGLAIYPALSSELQIAVGSVLTGSATPEEALATARERVDQAYELLGGAS